VISDELLLANVTACARTSFDLCVQSASGARVVGFAISTDESCSTFLPAIATAHELEQRPPLARNDFLFNPDEWRIGAPPEATQPVGKQLNELYQQCSDEENDENWHGEFRIRVLQVFVWALERLKDEGYFNPSSQDDDRFLMVWISDSVTPDRRGRAWSKRLNAPALHQEFVSWLDSRHAGV
jgi:hypothetical protein